MSTRRDGEGRARTLRRREFFGAAAAAGAGGVLAPEVAAAAPPAEGVADWVNGAVDRVEDGRTAWVTLGGRALPVRVELTAAATPRKEGPVRLTEFSRGERVTAGGHWEDGVFHADHFEELYELVDGVVRNHTHAGVQTTAGPVRFTEATTPRGGFALGESLEARPLDRIARGDRVIAMSRYEPNRGERVAVLIGVVE